MQLYLKEKLEIMIFAISFIAACHTLQPNINKLKISIIIIDSMGLRFGDVFLRQWVEAPLTQAAACGTHCWGDLGTLDLMRNSVKFVIMRNSVNLLDIHKESIILYKIFYNKSLWMHNGLHVCIIFLYDENSECILHIWIYIMLPQVLI